MAGLLARLLIPGLPVFTVATKIGSIGTDLQLRGQLPGYYGIPY
jgi:hypothetical protein